MEGEAIPQPILDLLAGFRVAAVEQIVDRLQRLLAERPFRMLAVSGGVAANRLLRPRLGSWAAEKGIDLRLVPLVYSGDNAAMIAHAALLRHAWGKKDDPLTIDAASRIPL
jgi:N6-L-threonylcarbamoyladenine synthase